MLQNLNISTESLIFCKRRGLISATVCAKKLNNALFNLFDNTVADIRPNLKKTMIQCLRNNTQCIYTQLYLEMKPKAFLFTSIVNEKYATLTCLTKIA